MNTNYKLSNGSDISTIFLPYTSGTQITTGFKLSNGSDISTLFQQYDGTSDKTQLTYYKLSNGNDLNTVFQNINVPYYGYNPFSASTQSTNYTYQIFSSNGTLNLTQDISGAYIVLVGGGGGAGAGYGYNGGGAGGEVLTLGPIVLYEGTYTITIGTGGQGAKIGQTTYSGTSGNTTTITGPNSFTQSATGGGFGSGGIIGSSGSGGQNSSLGVYGSGGDNTTKYTNIQPGSGVYTGDGQNGYLYTFQDGTNTTYYFGGGGGGGGSNSGSGTDPNTYLGGGGFVGTRNGYVFDADTGGCGGLGFHGINTGQNGWNFTFNNINYSNGSGGGAGGNNSSSNYADGGNGNNGTCIIYYPNV